MQGPFFTIEKWTFVVSSRESASGSKFEWFRKSRSFNGKLMDYNEGVAPSTFPKPIDDASGQTGGPHLPLCYSVLQSTLGHRKTTIITSVVYGRNQ
jgi:hypothetical protein